MDGQTDSSSEISLLERLNPDESQKKVEDIDETLSQNVESEDIEQHEIRSYHSPCAFSCDRVVGLLLVRSP